MLYVVVLGERKIKGILIDSILFKACEYCLYPLESCEQNVRRLCQDASIVLPNPDCDPNRTIEQTIVRCSKCHVGYPNKNRNEDEEISV